jgi:hypothetical protein
MASYIKTAVARRRTGLPRTLTNLEDCESVQPERAAGPRPQEVLNGWLKTEPNVDDERESPSYRMMDLLRQRDGEVAYHCKPDREPVCEAR